MTALPLSVEPQLRARLALAHDEPEHWLGKWRVE